MLLLFVIYNSNNKFSPLDPSLTISDAYSFLFKRRKEYLTSCRQKLTIYCKCQTIRQNRVSVDRMQIK
jgi:hypothetical protein